MVTEVYASQFECDNYFPFSRTYCECSPAPVAGQYCFDDGRTVKSVYVYYVCDGGRTCVPGDPGACSCA